MRTVNQDASSMNAALDSIWRMGDRDECSIKHVCHATAALAAGKDWSEGLDYSRPWGADETWIKTENLHSPAPANATVFEEWTIIPWSEQIKDMREKQLAKKWAKVQAKRDEWGAERFHEVMKATKFEAYHTSYFEDDWQVSDAEG
jgi:hypothetical protein